MTSHARVASGVRRDRALEKRIRAYLPARVPVYAFLELGSTMELAHELAKTNAPHGTLVLAARQTQGKGRLGRVWNSPKGGLYCSILLRPERPAAEAPQLSLVAGLAAAEAIRELTGLSPSIRWPNDLLLGRKKVAGILAEGSRLPGPPRPQAGAGKAQGNNLERSSLEPRALNLEPVVIVGIGVNITTRLKELPKEATTLAAFGAECELFRLAGLVHQRLSAWYDTWAARGFAPIREALRPWIGHFGQPVHITAGAEEFEGTASDLDESGRLLVRLDAGLIRPFEMGEVTLLR